MQLDKFIENLELTQNDEPQMLITLSTEGEIKIHSTLEGKMQLKLINLINDQLQLQDAKNLESLSPEEKKLMQDFENMEKQSFNEIITKDLEELKDKYDAIEDNVKRKVITDQGSSEIAPGSDMSLLQRTDVIKGTIIDPLKQFS